MSVKPSKTTTPVALLAAELGRRRGRNPRYSRRAFARALGVSSGVLTDLMSGKRTLGVRLGNRLAARLQLSEADLAIWNGALEGHGKKLARRRPLAGLAGKKPVAAKCLSEDSFAVISGWYHLAILNLLETVDGARDADGIAARLAITSTVTREALARLERLGLIGHDGRRWRRTELPLTTPRDLPSAAAREFHRETLGLAIRALEDCPVGSREISATTVAISTERLPEAKEIIVNFRRQLARLLEEGERTEVYHLTVALFPLTRKRDRK